MITYSASHKAFFDSALFSTLPADAVEISTTKWTDLLAAQAAGQLIAPDSNGHPVAAAPPSPPSPPAPLPLTVAQQAQAALAAGVAVTSAATPALAGTYAIDTAAQSHMQAELISLLVGNTFADGSSTVAWPDMAGTTHTFTIDQFKAFALAAGAYVAALFKVINGTTTTLPASPVAIA